MPKCSLRLLVLLICVAGTSSAQSAGDSGAPAAAPSSLTIPDGTPVILRFAEPLVGVPQFLATNSVDHARKGDRIQLVVASDIRVGGILVVRKGSVGQATVTKAQVPDRQFSDSGLELQFDWIESVSGQEVPIRRKQNGHKSGSFAVNLVKTRAGAVIASGWDHRSFADAWREYLNVKTMRQWTVIPTGTRIKAFVHGNVSLDASKVIEAQAELPTPNPTATVAIYREKGPVDQKPHVYCDDIDLGELNDFQYFMVEMDPGKHSCHPDQGEMIEISVTAGEEFYLHLHRTTFSGKWKLEVVDSAAGEDAITFSEQAVIKGPKSASQPLQP
jgi:hypothetical protein